MENRVTFTTEVKEEICSLKLEERELLSLTAGFVKVNGSLTLSSEGAELSLQSENSKVAKFIYNALKSLFQVYPSYSYKKKMKLDKGSIFGLHVKEKTTEILSGLELMEDGFPSFPRQIVLEDRLRYFIAGAFLASGSVNSPSSKNYHLQMVISEEEDARYFMKLLNRFRNDKAMDFKMIARRNKYVLYLKKADQIATFLSIVQAHECLMDFENARIEKDFLNSDNRIQVCFNANYRKSLIKGEAQCEEIRALKESGRFFDLSEKERAIAELRLANPDASLSHISQLMKEEKGIVLSKSGINHVMNKIHAKYQESVRDR